MKANIDSSTDQAPRSARSRTRLVSAAAAVALLALTACTSDPGAKRVAEDIVEGEFEQGSISESERDCMLEVLDPYSQDELEQIAADLDNADASTSSEAEADLADLQAQLTACRE
ncbi:MAG: hypothetical protein AB8G26_19790 [Ilumatobacter sp.]